MVEGDLPDSRRGWYCVGIESASGDLLIVVDEGCGGIILENFDGTERDLGWLHIVDGLQGEQGTCAWGAVGVMRRAVDVV
jgi:alkylation response protein AidB-like acyl-CoA dehydrogenase